MAAIHELGPEIKGSAEASATSIEVEKLEYLETILERFGANLTIPHLSSVALLFFDRPKKWMTLADFLNGPEYQETAMRIGSSNLDIMRSHYFRTLSELTRVEFLQQRQTNTTRNLFETREFWFNPAAFASRLKQLDDDLYNDTSVADKTASWQDEANCLGVDPELFFPERGASTREAKEVCRGCIVRLECLDYSLDNVEKFGIWGGMSERERRRLRRQRALAAKAINTESSEDKQSEA